MNSTNKISNHIAELKSLSNSELYFESDLEKVDELENSKILVTNIDINMVPKIDSLRTLILDVKENNEICSLDRFPNLEELKIYSNYGLSIKVKSGFPEKLKALVLRDIDLSSLEFLCDLPNLEQLDLRFNSLNILKNLDSLTGLKSLELAGNNLEEINGLEHLKGLQYLNLANNNISDITILNGLPSLRFVNIDGNRINKKDVPCQLEKPEIAIYADLPGEWETYTGYMDFVDLDYKMLVDHL